MGYAEITSEMSEELKHEFFKFDHGFPLLIYWGIAAIATFAVKRYLKYGKYLGLVLHVLAGTVITVMTLVIGTESMIMIEWQLPSDFNIHCYFAMAVVALVLMLPVLGFTSIIVGECKTPKTWGPQKDI